MFTLPESLRDSLRRPMGPVLAGGAALDAVRDATNVVTVGDITTLTFLEAGRPPRVMVIDHKTRRTSEVPGLAARLADPSFRRVAVKNPAASVTSELWDAVAHAYAAPGRTVIEVDGEEDLATLPAIFLAPEGTVVVYGQPEEGVVVVEVTREARDAVRRILGRMERNP